MRVADRYLASSKGKKEGSSKPSEEAKSLTEKAKTSDTIYPRKIEIDPDMAPQEREHMFPQPSIRTTAKLERDLWTSGVMSPSDSRRPPEQPATEQPSKTTNYTTPPSKDTLGGQEVNWTPKEAKAQEFTPAEDSYRVSKITPDSAPTNMNSSEANKEAAARETSFIEEFLADKPQPREAASSEKARSDDWKQTVLDRRAAFDFVPKLRRRTDVPVIDVTAKRLSDMSPGSIFEVAEETTKTKERFRPAMEKRGGSMGPPAADSKVGDDWLVHSEKSIEVEQPKSEELETPPPRRSTAKILEQLPKDDMDFLSADEIRANMGRIRSPREDKEERQKLEKDFKDAHKEWQLDPLVGAKIFNDQHIRRKERELLQAQAQEQEQAKAVQQEEPEAMVPPREEQIGAKSPKEVSVLETSLDFMSRWLQTGGDVFARHFWQDPVAEQDRAKTSIFGEGDPFLKGVFGGIQKGRRAMFHVKEELQTDIPASKSLLARLTKDERNVAFAASSLRTKSLDRNIDANGDEVRMEIRNRIRKLRQSLLETDKEFKEACEAVDSMKTAPRPSEAFERRITASADVLQKNAKLTRMMIFGLQARWESAAADQSGQKLRDLAHRLLALQDTQLALLRLVGRAMQVLGIKPKTMEETIVQAPEDTAAKTSSPSDEALSSPKDTEGEAERRLRVAAANEKLENEIDAQKAAMRGLSDDGYSRSPKPVTKKHFDEPNPLAHSPFRPFGLQLESLGKDDEAAKTELDEAARKAKEDKELVREVKRAYEDVYGPITVKHRQVPSGEQVPEQAKPEAAKLVTDEANATVEEVKRDMMQLLKEDTVSPAFSTPKTPAVASDNSSTSNAESKPEDMVAGSLKIAPKEPPPTNSRGEPAAMHEDNAPATSATTEGEPKPLDKPSSEASLNNENTDAIDPFDEFPQPQPGALLHIYTYDPQTEEILITTSKVGSMPTLPPAIPVHEALATLSNPSKFIPHLHPGYDIISAKPNMLVLRPNGGPLDLDGFHTVRVPASGEPEARDEGWKGGINPIDGTTTLSPTGYVGDGLELERDFQERRRAAGDGWRVERDAGRSRDRGKERKGGGFASVMKTGIVAAAGCYVVGVIGELFS